MLRHRVNRPNSLVEDAWLEMGSLDGIEINNPLLGRSKDELENPGLLELRTMRNPDYLSFAAKTLLNVDLPPVQAMIMQELWTRPFPMYVAARGFGKAQPLDSPILTENGWVRMGDIKVGDKIYGRDGLKHNVTAIHPQGKKRVCRLTLLDGRTIDCCEDHLWVIRPIGPKEKVVTTKSIIDGGLFYKNKGGGPCYKYRVPNCEPIELPKKDLPVDPYIIGCLLGDGCITTETPAIASEDDFIVDEFKKRLVGFEIKNGHYHDNDCKYTIVDKNKSIEKRGTRRYRRNRLTVALQDLKINISCKNKFIPDIYKYSSIEDRLELVRGLIDTDGCVNKSGSIEFTNTSEKLVDDIIEVLRSLGITCTKSEDSREGQEYFQPRTNIPSTRGHYYRVYINTSQKIAKLPRKLERIKSKPTNAEKFVAIVKAEYTDEYEEMQCITVDSPDHTYITKDHIVTHNSFLGAVYISLKCALCPGTKAVVVGAAFRQSKIIWQYMKDIWENAPVLRSVCDNNSGARSSIDRCIMTINNSVALFLPIGIGGDKIRGARANLIWNDEFSSIDPNIFETVIRGFAAVSQKPIDKMKAAAKKKALIAMGATMHETKIIEAMSNQCIVSGTADYDFMHFAEYWRKYHTYIQSKGDVNKPVTLPNGETRYLRDYFPEGLDKSFDYRDYSIIRVPYELIPDGYMDAKIVSEAKSNSTKSSYLREYGAVFPSDSDGFFKRSLIHSCIGTDINPVKLNGNEIFFDAATVGIPGKKYVFGIDPAAESDNFAIVILEVWPDHSRVVFSWSTNIADFQKRRSSGTVEDHDYYSFCARKIRNLMKAFPTDDIALDAQGGGRSILEALHDPYNLKDGESLIWPTNRIMAPDKKLDTDSQGGLHIVHLCQFANADFTSGANHGTRKDLEDKTLLFPRFDPVTLELANQKDIVIAKRMGVEMVYDTLEDCAIEIESLKDELCTIVMTRTTHGNRDRWDTPETTTAEGKKTRMRKDRYSALIMANYIARSIKRAPEQVTYDAIGGFAHQIKGRNKAGKKSGPMYTGPAWYTSSIESQKYGAVKKRH